MQHHAQPLQNQSTLQRNKAADYDTADSIFDDSIPSGAGDYHGLDVDDFILYVPVTNEIPVTKLNARPLANMESCVVSVCRYMATSPLQTQTCDPLVEYRYSPARGPRGILVRPPAAFQTPVVTVPDCADGGRTLLLSRPPGGGDAGSYTGRMYIHNTRAFICYTAPS